MLVAVLGFITYGLLLVVSITATAVRLYRFRRGRVAYPRLLERDLVLVGGHAIALLILLANRAFFRLPETDELLNILVYVPALLAIGTYAYYELFVIGR